MWIERDVNFPVTLSFVPTLIKINCVKVVGLIFCDRKFKKVCFALFKLFPNQCDNYLSQTIFRSF